jgi:hypothetical protein
MTTFYIREGKSKYKRMEKIRYQAKDRFKQLLTETAGLGPLPGSACLFAIRLVLVSIILQRRVALVVKQGGLCCHRLFFHHCVLRLGWELLDNIASLCLWFKMEFKC